GSHASAGFLQLVLILYAGDAEVRDLDPEVRCHEDVAGLDVAVDDSDLVRGPQRLCGLGDDAQRIGFGQGRAAFDDGRQRLTGNVLHDQVGRALFVTVVVDSGDSGIVDPPHVLRLGAEAGE